MTYDEYLEYTGLENNEDSYIEYLHYCAEQDNYPFE